MPDAGGSAAIALTVTGTSASDSQATTLATQDPDDLAVEGLDALEAHPGLEFSGADAAREV